MKYQKLNQREIAEIHQLKNKGVRVSFIGRFAQAYYGVARSTVYRYVSDNRHWYNEKTREQLLHHIQNLLCQGYTSKQIAMDIGEPLKRVNKLIIDNKISCLNCQE